MIHFKANANYKTALCGDVHGNYGTGWRAVSCLPCLEKYHERRAAELLLIRSKLEALKEANARVREEFLRQHIGDLSSETKNHSI